MNKVDFQAEVYVISWFSNFFSREFPIEYCIKIYDHLMFTEYFEIFFAAAIMLELRETFEIKESDGIMGCLKNIANNINF